MWLFHFLDDKKLLRLIPLLWEEAGETTKDSFEGLAIGGNEPFGFAWCLLGWWGQEGFHHELLLMDKIRLTTKDDDYPIIYRVLTIPGGAGFLSSTVGCRLNDGMCLDHYYRYYRCE